MERPAAEERGEDTAPLGDSRRRRRLPVDRRDQHREGPAALRRLLANDERRKKDLSASAHAGATAASLPLPRGRLQSERAEAISRSAVPPPDRECVAPLNPPTLPCPLHLVRPSDRDPHGRRRRRPERRRQGLRRRPGRPCAKPASGAGGFVRSYGEGQRG